MTTRLNNPDFMTFPLKIGSEGAVTSTLQAHVREQIVQVLATNFGERWYRPEFGVGVRALVFEPNNQALWEITKKRLLASLSEALTGEVEPSSLEVGVEDDEEKLILNISYRLATINHTESMQFAVEGNP